jgi:hypothetical protein
MIKVEEIEDAEKEVEVMKKIRQGMLHEAARLENAISDMNVRIGRAYREKKSRTKAAESWIE